jgi:PIN domain nuclease of toxin-antitoxin system
MKILLDTHAFLWIIHGDNNVSKKAKDCFIEPQNKLFLSAASYWEICIKQSIGKLRLLKNWSNIIDVEMVESSISWLPIEKSHCTGIMSLPYLHRDPFDRMLIAQAICEGLTILTADENIVQYNIPTVW